MDVLYNIGTLEHRILLSISGWIIWMLLWKWSLCFSSFMYHLSSQMCMKCNTPLKSVVLIVDNASSYDLFDLLGVWPFWKLLSLFLRWGHVWFGLCYWLSEDIYSVKFTPDSDVAVIFPKFIMFLLLLVVRRRNVMWKVRHRI